MFYCSLDGIKIDRPLCRKRRWTHVGHHSHSESCKSMCLGILAPSIKTLLFLISKRAATA